MYAYVHTCVCVCVLVLGHGKDKSQGYKSGYKEVYIHQTLQEDQQVEKRKDWSGGQSQTCRFFIKDKE